MKQKWYLVTSPVNGDCCVGKCVHRVQSVVFYFDLIKIWLRSTACYECLSCINYYLTLLFSCVISGFRRDVDEN